jgi:hypothetical protein
MAVKRSWRLSVDHGETDALVELLQLRAQAPLEVGVDHRQWLVEHDRVHVRAHQAPAERDLLLAVGGQSRGPRAKHRSQVEQLRDLAHPGAHARLGHPAIPQREREVVVDGHRVVDDRELEYLRDVALVRRPLGHVRVAEEDPPRGRPEEARDDVQQGRLAAAGGAEERVRPAVGPLEVDAFQRPVGVARRIARVAVPQLLEADARHLSPRGCHGSGPHAATRTPSGRK